ncbi:arachidonate 12-lipoxygenase, 12R-type-like [Poecilia latipinna]|uniref:Arachidonate 12-lipoxygenase, 12R-type-like n=1 Tax=Poecilia formosa TaxID=48698 RepID=A0A087Y4R8_POEFO|nr:PREDICTED: arachidonate 12-lipoxygenase, 12R-type-like [Poecilia formosa]XP_014895109.1 PREDICTED: arachidonate 12-lipoxygenase, 12R-type-like [Poecilia latipinna]
MVTYEITVEHSTESESCTLPHVDLKLVGEKGMTKSAPLSENDNYKELVSKCTIDCDDPIGKLLRIEIKKRPLYVVENNWFLKNIKVKDPNGETYYFPIYTWITDCKKHSFNEGQALIAKKELSPSGRFNRHKKLSQLKETYCWQVFEKGIPHHIQAMLPSHLPRNDQFIEVKQDEFKKNQEQTVVWKKLKESTKCYDTWPDFEQISELMDYSKYDILGYVKDNWKDDAFFGYQFLNGINPMLIQRCTSLPDNFPVTEHMICHYCNLPQEIEKGNIYLCNYQILDGVATRDIKGKKQYLMAPLVLLHKTAEDKLMPIAIQLQQKPGADNPIFLPSDSEHDWLLAKIFVRSAEFNFHQLNCHLLRTHLLSEVFAVSLMRNLPMVHPLYKLLIPHSRYTLHINTMARLILISETGAFTQVAASGGEGMIQILRKSLSSMTYRSLCIPDDIEDRGMKDIPNFFYRDDGLKLWDILHRFVEGILKHYYKTDDDVQNDRELEDWIWDIFEHGFLCPKEKSGIPLDFKNVNDLAKFVTMVIFTSSVQHAAVNSGQFDYGGWMPNLPSTLRRPPPSTKGEATEATILETLPDKSITLAAMTTLYLLSRRYSDFVPFGTYPEHHFTEEQPLKLMEKFKEELKELSKVIKERNIKLDVPYKYLDPEEIENSVSI